jgi:hypothetical protein
LALALIVLAKIGSAAPDTEKSPVEGAKVFFRHERKAKTHLDPVGTTDGSGRLVALVCYQATGEYYDSPPEGEITLAFMVSYKDHEVRRVVGADALLRDGLLFSQIHPRPVPRPGLKQNAAFRIKVQVVLRDAA